MPLTGLDWFVLNIIDLVKYCKFEGAFTFIYSKREGTPAEHYEDVMSFDNKKQHLYELNDIINIGYLEGNKRFEGERVKVLVDGLSKNNDEVLAGYTENNKLVNFTGDKSLIGKIVDVNITNVKTWHMNGELVE